MADEVVKPKKTRAPAKPRKLYIAYKSNAGGELEVALVTRKAEELLNLATSDREIKYTVAEV